MRKFIAESWAMSMRCLRTMFRSPDAFGSAIITPAAVMFLFGRIFAISMDFGDYSAINFIMAGIILQTIAQATTGTAISINNDMTKGIIDRFSSMPIAKSAVLTGHVFASIVRNLITTSIAVGVAFLIGFRPQVGFIHGLIVIAILLLYMLAITWIAVIAGLTAQNGESAGNKMFLLFIIPYLSSGFVPVERLSGWMRVFATYQPFTPIIDSLRGLMLGIPVESSTIWIAVAWCAGFAVAAFIASVQVYKRRVS